MNLCAKCLGQLVEPSGLPVDKRTPCPTCGSLDRLVSRLVQDAVTVTDSATATLIKRGASDTATAVETASVTIIPPTLEASAEMRSPTIAVSGKAADALSQLRLLSVRLDWTLPRKGETLYSVQVYRDDVHVTSAVGTSADDVLFDVVEKLGPDVDD